MGRQHIKEGWSSRNEGDWEAETAREQEEHLFGTSYVPGSLLSTGNAQNGRNTVPAHKSYRKGANKVISKGKATFSRQA